MAGAQKGAATWGTLWAVLLAGLFAGLIGLVQWLILRRQAGRAGWWVVASTGASALAQTVYAASLPYSSPALVLALLVAILLRLGYQSATLVAAGFLGQAAGGAITGAVLVWLLKPGTVRAPAGEPSPNGLAARGGGI